MKNRMERVDRIVDHPRFQSYLKDILEAEKDRIFCKHDMGHLLDVARIAWIINLEEEAALQRDMVYAAAFLHDIGKVKQYQDKTPHQITGSEWAGEILKDCGFDEEEKQVICEAILQHRNPEVQKEKNLRGILYRADKASRSCYGCQAQAECDWPREKKNLFVKY